MAQRKYQYIAHCNIVWYTAIYCNVCCLHVINAQSLCHKMTGPLDTWIIHFSFYTVIQGVRIFFSSLPKLIFPYEMSFYQNPIKYCNMAIYCNTLKHNMQYGIDPNCFTPNTYICIYIRIIHTYVHIYIHIEYS